LKRVLVVAYQFPPVGGSGVQRTLKFVKFLPSAGWMPEVLTRDDGRMVQRDDTLLAEVPEAVSIVRTRAWDLTALPWKLALVGKFVAWKLLVPDGEILWMRGAEKTARNRAAVGGIDAIYTTSYPYTDHLIGLKLRAEFPDIRWVADFRDEWTNNPYLLDHPHPPGRMRREKAMERAVLEKADVLVTNSPGMKANFVRTNPDLDLIRRMHVIPNGFDPDDFDAVETAAPKNDRFTLTYTGALYGRRKPDLFLEAIGRLVSEGRLDRASFRIRFIGSYKPDAIRALAVMNGIADNLALDGYQPHGACLQAMSGSDALLLLEGGGPGAEAFFTGKVFEYIHTERPILAVVPERGAAAGVVRDTKTGVVCDCGDLTGIMAGYMQLYNAWREGRTVFEPVRDRIAAYDRRVLTEKLAALLSGETK